MHQELIELSQTLYTSKSPTRRWLHCSRRDWVVEQIIKHSDRESTKALEVGPGAGMYLPCLCESCRSVTASDIEDTFLNHIQKTFARDNLSAIKDDITNTSQDHDSFDLILCTEVLEHIHDTQAGLKCLASLLKPGGTLILTTPQKYSSMEMCARIAWLPGIIHLVRMIYGEIILDAGHISLLTEKQVKAQLAETALTIQEEHKTGCYMPIIAEVFGNAGRALATRMESVLRGSSLDWLLWTQMFLLTKGKGTGAV